MPISVMGWIVAQLEGGRAFLCVLSQPLCPPLRQRVLTRRRGGARLRPDDTRPPSRRSCPPARQGLDRRRPSVSGARHRRQHCHLQRPQWPPPEADSRRGAGDARTAALCRPQRHGDELQRLRLHEQTGRRERARDLLVRHVSAIPDRQPHDDRSLRGRAIQPCERRRRRPGGDRHGLHLNRKLLPSARREGAGRPPDRAGRRSSGGAARGRHQLQVLAHPVHDRSRRDRQDHPRERRRGHCRRCDSAEVHRHPAARGRAGGRSVSSFARAPAEHPGAIAPGPTDVLVAADHGPAEAGRHRRASPGEPRGRLPAHSSSGARVVHEVTA